MSKIVYGYIIARVLQEVNSVYAFRRGVREFFTRIMHNFAGDFKNYSLDYLSFLC